MKETRKKDFECILGRSIWSCRNLTVEVIKSDWRKFINGEHQGLGKWLECLPRWHRLQSKCWKRLWVPTAVRVEKNFCGKFFLGVFWSERTSERWNCWADSCCPACQTKWACFDDQRNEFYYQSVFTPERFERNFISMSSILRSCGVVSLLHRNIGLAKRYIV